MAYIKSTLMLGNSESEDDSECVPNDPIVLFPADDPTQKRIIGGIGPISDPKRWLACSSNRN